MITKDEINNIADRQSGRHHKKPNAMLQMIRNILNIIFMAGALFGIIYYFSIDKSVGTYIILVSMAFKIVESAIRLLKL